MEGRGGLKDLPLGLRNRLEQVLDQLDVQLTRDPVPAVDEVFNLGGKVQG